MSKLFKKKVSLSPYVYSMGNKFLYCVITFLANALFTRALGIQLKGEYTWYINFASMLSIVLGMGVYHSMPYYMRKEPEKNWTSEYMSIFYVQAIIYLFSLFIICLLFENKNRILSIGILSIVECLAQQLSMLLLIEKINWKNAIYLLGAFTNLAFSIICCLFFKNNLLIILGCYLAVKLLYIILYTWKIGVIPDFHNVSILKVAKKIKFGYLPMLSLLLITANYKIDVLMLEASPSVSAEQLSMYSTGVSIAEIGWVVPDVFKEVLFSRIAKKKNDAEVSSALRLSNVVIFFVILGVIFLGKYLIYFFYGVEFVPAHKITILLFLGIPAMSWFKIIYQLFNAEGRRKLSFGFLFMSTLINVIANYLMIPHYGIYGAAIASLISYTVCGLSFIILYSLYYKISLLSLFVFRKNDFKILFKIK